MTRLPLVLTFLASVLSAYASGGAAKITAHFYRLGADLDTQSIKAIGSVETKTSPTILQVSKQEMKRVCDLAVKQRGTLIAGPAILTKLGQQASIQSKLDDGSSCAMTVVPDTKSDTISLHFKLSLSTREGNRIVTRSATGLAKVVESRALLVIEDGRDGQPGMLVVLEAVRK